MFDWNKLKFWKRPRCYYCSCPDVKWYKPYETDKGKKKMHYYCDLCYKLRYLQGR